MTEQEKALILIKELRKASYNHSDFGTDMAIEEPRHECFDDYNASRRKKK